MKTGAFVHCSAFGRLAVEVYRDRGALGRAAARACAARLRDAIAARGAARVIFAGTPSQDEFLAALGELRTAVAWPKVTAFQLGEYLGLPATARQSFRHYLREHLLDRVAIGRFHEIEPGRSDLAAAGARYAALLSEKPIDLICLGIGENGQLGFNAPSAADFADERLVKPVELDATYRQQQVDDGCFPRLDDVPRQALTLTLPVFRGARRLSVHAPGPHKAAVVRATLHDAITTACPATLLRLHRDATLYLDLPSAAFAFNPNLPAVGPRPASQS